MILPRQPFAWFIAIVGVGLVFGGVVEAQELTPRAYWPAPSGTNVLVIGYVYSAGDVVTDPTLPVLGTDSRNNVAMLGYQRNFSLAGRSASLLVSVPYVWGTTKASAALEGWGIVGTRHLSDIGDARIRMAVNLIGAPAMDMREFQGLRANPRPILGASVQVAIPTGGYDATKLLNVGTNRWSFKADLGYIQPIRSTWQLEFDLGVWFFTDNDEFLGQTREQNPILASEVHLVKLFRRGIWASFDWNYYAGGQTTVAGVLKATLQRNSRIGGTVVVPFGGRHAAKVTFSTGVIIRAGGDFSSLQLNYQFVWQ